MADQKSNLWEYIGLSMWLILNIIQASYTELSHDEAYYWMYSRFLDWGYFDHPPAIAVIIKLGYLLIQSELGVRLFSIVLSVLTLYLLIKIIKPQNNEYLLFFVIVFSIPLVHAGGFLATPDIPFIFFTTCFFYIYKSYIENDNWGSVVLLSFIMALLMYSKYHGVLVIFFTIISDFKLLAKKSFWVAGIFACILFTPHLIWQYQHDFPSFKYHLFERSSGGYKTEQTLEYIGGQLLFLGPLTGLLLLIAAIKNRNSDTYIKTLKYNFIGIFVFFLLSSFRSRVEANWTSAAYIPLMILALNTLREKSNLRRWAMYLAIPTIFLILAGRVVLMLDELPLGIKAKSEFHQWKNWAQQIEKKAKGHPVVFMNSYQKASKYTFYTGGFAHTLNNYMYRKNQYDIWPFEDTLQGKKIFLIPNYPIATDSMRNVWGETVNYIFIDNFSSYNKVKIKLIKGKKVVLANDSVYFSIQLKNEGSYIVNVNENPMLPSQLSVNFYLNGRYISTEFLPLELALLKQGDITEQEIKFKAPEVAGKYNFRVATYSGWLPMGLNSDLYKLEVKEK